LAHALVAEALGIGLTGETLVVLTTRRAASLARLLWEWPRGSGWLSGASPLFSHHPARVNQRRAIWLHPVRRPAGQVSPAGGS